MGRISRSANFLLVAEFTTALLSSLLSGFGAVAMGEYDESMMALLDQCTPPMDTRVVLPRGPHLRSMTYGSGGILTGEWDGLSRSPSLAVQLMALDGTDIKPFELNSEDTIEIVVTLRGRAGGKSDDISSAQVARSSCHGEAFIICPVSLASLQVSGLYELAVNVKWKSQNGISSSSRFTDEMMERDLPERKVNIQLTHSREVTSLSFISLPPYMLSGSFYSWSAHLMDATSASLAGVLTPFEGLNVEVEAWLGHRRYPAAHGIIQNSSVVFKHVFVNLSETQSVMLVARVGTIQTEPKSLTIHKCPTQPGERGRLLEVVAGSASLFGSSKGLGRSSIGGGNRKEKIPLLHHSQAFSIRIAAAQPSITSSHPRIPQYLCRLGQDEDGEGSLALQAKLFRTKSKKKVGRRVNSEDEERRNKLESSGATAIGHLMDPCSVVCEFPPFSAQIPVVSSYVSVLENSRRGFSRSSIRNVTELHFSGYSSGVTGREKS